MMARKVNEELRETWRQRLERQRRSGLTVAEFSRQEGVSTASFYRWQQEVGASSIAPANQKASRRPAKTVARSTRTAPAAQAHATFVQLPVAATSTTPWIEVMLTDGTLIRLPQQNLAALQAVLQVCQGAARVPVLGAMPHV